MVSRNQLEAAFREWNVTGRGRDRASAGNYHYVGPVLYYSDSGWKRCLRAADGGIVIATKMNAANSRAQVFNAYPSSQEQGKLSGRFKYRSWMLPEIGVLSRHENDLMPEDELHTRMQKVFLMEVRAVLPEKLRLASGGTLALTSVQSVYNNHYNRYQNYSNVFGLDWSPLSLLWRDEGMAFAEKKVHGFHTPEAIAARERTAARRVAVKAMGLG